MKCHKWMFLTIKQSALINTDSVNKADRNSVDGSGGESMLEACLDSEQDPSRHCWLALKGCKTGNNL